jgi:hypothetical protein
VGGSAHQNREELREERGRAAHRGEERKGTRSPEMVAAGGWEFAGGGGVSRQRQRELRAGRQGEEITSLARLGRAVGGFLKREMGTPDSLQWLSGAHRTAHSSCPVNHRTAHRKRGILRAAAGAPDIAQCSVRCTPDCPVSPDRGEFGKF